MAPGPSRGRRRAAVLGRLLVVCVAAWLNLGWSPATIRRVAWSAVEFFPPDLERQVRRHHRRFDAGIERGLQSPPAWRAGLPGSLVAALKAQVEGCVSDLNTPVPLEDLVEELGVLAVRVLDANDPLAVDHSDPREPSYAAEYSRYVTTILDRVRLVYYGQDEDLIRRRKLDGAVDGTLVRSRELYPFVGAEFYRTGSLRSWNQFDDRSVAFGVAAVALSHAMTDLANLVAYVWQGGGGLVPAPQPTPTGHTGPTVTLALEGGFPERERPRDARRAVPATKIVLPQP